jgi:hypothetical protein
MRLQPSSTYGFTVLRCPCDGENSRVFLDFWFLMPNKSKDVFFMVSSSIRFDVVLEKCWLKENGIEHEHDFDYLYLGKDSFFEIEDNPQTDAYKEIGRISDFL